MKRFALISFLLIALLIIPRANAQGNFYEEFKKYDKDQLEDAANAVVESFGIGVTGGLYHTARTHGTLGFDLGGRAMFVIVPEGESDVLDSADVTAFTVPVLQASLGLPVGLEVMVRGSAVKFKGETVSLIGAGVKKNLDSYIPVPAFPSVSAMVAYHQFKAGDVITSRHFSIAAMVSKKFVIIQPYGGLGWDYTSMNFEYSYQPPIGDEVLVDETIKVNTVRLTMGLSVTPLPFVNVFADYNISKYSEVTAGLAVSLR